MQCKVEEFSSTLEAMTGALEEAKQALLEKERQRESVSSQLCEQELKWDDFVKQHQAELEDLKSRLAAEEVESTNLKSTIKDLEGKIKEADTRDQVTTESHRRNVQVIMEKLESVERERTELELTVSSLTTSLELKEKEYLNSLSIQQELEGKLKESMDRIEDLEKKVEEQANLNNSQKRQLEFDHQQSEQELRGKLEHLQADCERLQRIADESTSMVELLKSSLKTRQEQHEQSIEDLARAKNELERLRDVSNRFEHLEDELRLSKVRVEELERQVREKPVPQEEPSTSKSEYKLRLELERIREGAVKDRKMAQLRIADLEEQLAELKSGHNQELAKIKTKFTKLEEEKDSETAKVRQLQAAIQQLHANENRENHNVLKPEQPKPVSDQPKQQQSSEQPNECLQQ